MIIHMRTNVTLLQVDTLPICQHAQHLVSNKRETLPLSLSLYSVLLISKVSVLFLESQ